MEVKNRVFEFSIVLRNDETDSGWVKGKIMNGWIYLGNVRGRITVDDDDDGCFLG